MSSTISRLGDEVMALVGGGRMRITIEANGEIQVYELDEDAMRALQAIAARNEVSLGEALIQAIATEKFIEDQERSGAKLLIEKDDKLRELVRTPDPLRGGGDPC